MPVASGWIRHCPRSRWASGCREWLALQVQLKPTTMVRYEVALRRQILPRWELVPLARITHSDVSSWVHGLTDEGLAPATVRYAHRVLSLALTAAVRDGRLVRNVAEGVPLPRVVATPKRFLTHDQVQALAEACAPYDTLIRVLAYAGIWCGHCRGRCDRSAKPSRPSASYLPSQACRLCRDTPIAAAASVTVRPSLITASTARYRCSATLISLIRECQGSAEVTVNHQPKLCKASAEVEKSSLSRRNTTISEPPRGIEPRTYALRVASRKSTYYSPSLSESTDGWMCPRSSSP